MTFNEVWMSIFIVVFCLAWLIDDWIKFNRAERHKATCKCTCRQQVDHHKPTLKE